MSSLWTIARRKIRSKLTEPERQHCKVSVKKYSTENYDEWRYASARTFLARQSSADRFIRLLRKSREKQKAGDFLRDLRMKKVKLNDQIILEIETHLGIGE